jgi:carbonic anhydrase
MENNMEYLYSGVEKYTNENFAQRQGLMQELANGQAPKTLMLTCSDSRIAVGEMTNTAPGEVFVIRNAGNVIEAYNEENPSNEALTLEYGVSALGVKEIVVCGHVSCGAMAGVQDLDGLDALPLVKKGLTRVSKQFTEQEVKTCSGPELIELNVEKQLLNLNTYPFIKEKVQDGSLEVWGWVYDFVNGNIKTKVSLKDILNKKVQ